MNRNELLRLLRLPVASFFIALLGFVCNAAGWYVFESRPIAVAGFVIGVLGIALGFIGVAIGQVSVISSWISRLTKRDKQ